MPSMPVGIFTRRIGLDAQPRRISISCARATANHSPRRPTRTTSASTSVRPSSPNRIASGSCHGEPTVATTASSEIHATPSIPMACFCRNGMNGACAGGNRARSSRHAPLSFASRTTSTTAGASAPLRSSFGSSPADSHPSAMPRATNALIALA
jgi:hypothetical protein